MRGEQEWHNKREPFSLKYDKPLGWNLNTRSRNAKTQDKPTQDTKLPQAAASTVPKQEMTTKEETCVCLQTKTDKYAATDAKSHVMKVLQTLCLSQKERRLACTEQSLRNYSQRNSMRLKTHEARKHVYTLESFLQAWK